MIDTTRQDGIAVRYIVDFETGMVEVWPPKEYGGQPCISKKTLSEEELQTLKELAYYYFAA